MKTFVILFIVTSHAMLGNTGKPTGLWLEELTTPYYAFIDAGYEVQIVSIAGGNVPIDPRSKAPLGQNPESVDRFLKDTVATQKLVATASIEQVDMSNYDVVFLPGGHGTMWDLPNNKTLAILLGKAMDEGKVVAAVCHGPAGLVNAKLSNGDSIVKGKKVSAFTNEEEEAVELTKEMPFLLEARLRELGADFQEAPNFQAFAVSDGNLITGQNPASSEKVANLVIEYLNNKKK